MVRYNPKDWVHFIFNFHRADTIRKLFPLLVAMTVYSLAIAVFIIDVWQLHDSSDLRNISIMHSLLGFVISTLLVFRTNTAYDRWYEGRKQWGSLVNNSRNLALKMHQMLDSHHTEARDFFQIMIPNFSASLKNHLRNQFIEKDFIECATFQLAHLNQKEHVPQQIASALFGKAYALEREGILRPEHLLVVNPEIQSLMDICGACERIRNTPIPFSYSSFLKKFVTLYCLTLPLGYVFNLHYLVVPFVVFVFYVLASLEVIAEEIEDPFGTDANDLPTDQLAVVIRNTVYQVFGQAIQTVNVKTG
ncbi:bestrophin family ion channel [Nibrella viscosa]|uniref:Bestrophin family ion channel n=1 Tax=Nibrella viscosa TaxID=1084524 RepID=A0ABP8KQV4_9BACT